MKLPDPRERPWLSIAEVAEISCEGEKAIRSAVVAGDLPHLSVGRYVRIPTAALWQLCGIPLSSRDSDDVDSEYNVDSKDSAHSKDQHDESRTRPARIASPDPGGNNRG